MRAFLIGAAFVLTCSLFAGMFTGIMFKLAEDPMGCEDTKLALEDYRVQHSLTVIELERLERLIGRWGSTN
jgi:hypothetical protein